MQAAGQRIVTIEGECERKLCLLDMLLFFTLFIFYLVVNISSLDSLLSLHYVRFVLAHIVLVAMYSCCVYKQHLF